MVEEACGRIVRFQCPYHAWIYDLEGKLVRAKHTEDLDDFSLEAYSLATVRLETWQGFVFVNLSPEGPSLRDQLGDLVEHLERFDFGRLRSAKRTEYEVGANWKFIAENYSECYHCPGVHPQLNKLTPYDLGGDFEPHGAWQGGWMELVGEAETMALDGGHGSRDGRPPMPGITPVDERRIFYYVLWPMTFISIHPDYLLLHRLIPDGPDRTRVVCDWLFDVDTIAMPGFDPSDAVAFWDLTNRQDWHVCELQQRGTRSSSWVAGRYLEPGGIGPRVRPDGRRPLCRRSDLGRPDGPGALRRAAAQARVERRRRLEREGRGEGGRTGEGDRAGLTAPWSGVAGPLRLRRRGERHAARCR